MGLFVIYVRSFVDRPGAVPVPDRDTIRYVLFIHRSYRIVLITTWITKDLSETFVSPQLDLAWRRGARLSCAQSCLRGPAPSISKLSTRLD